MVISRALRSADYSVNKYCRSKGLTLAGGRGGFTVLWFTAPWVLQAQRQ